MGCGDQPILAAKVDVKSHERRSGNYFLEFVGAAMLYLVPV